MPFDDLDEDLQKKKKIEAREQERIDNAPLYDPFTGEHIQVIRTLRGVKEKFGVTLPDPKLLPENLILLRGSISDFKGIFCHVWLKGRAFRKAQSAEAKEKKRKFTEAAALLQMIGGSPVYGSALYKNAQNEDKYDVLDYSPALFVTAKLNGDIQLQGWLGYFEFQDGDEVVVVAEKHPQHYEVYAILRPKDQLMSIMPTCPWGRGTLWITGFLVSLGAFLFFGGIILLLIIREAGGFSHFYEIFDSDLIGIMSICGGLIGIASIQVYRLYRGSYILAEKIFKAIGWKKPAWISLARMKKRCIQRLMKKGEYPPYDPETQFGKRPAIKNNAAGLYYYDLEIDEQKIVHP